MSASGVESQKADHNPPTGASQVSTVEQGSCDLQVITNLVQTSTQLPTNIFNGDTLGHPWIYHFLDYDLGIGCI